MKRLLAALLLMALAAVTQAASADCPSDGSRPCVTFFDAAVANADVGPFILTGYNRASIQITSAAGSTATVNIYRRNTSADPWVNVLSLTDPSSTELGYDIPAVGEVRFELFWTAGVINGTLVRAK